MPIHYRPDGTPVEVPLWKALLWRAGCFMFGVVLTALGLTTVSNADGPVMAAVVGWLAGIALCVVLVLAARRLSHARALGFFPVAFFTSLGVGVVTIVLLVLAPPVVSGTVAAGWGGVFCAVSLLPGYRSRAPQAAADSRASYR